MQTDGAEGHNRDQKTSDGPLTQAGTHFENPPQELQDLLKQPYEGFDVLWDRKLNKIDVDFRLQSVSRKPILFFAPFLVGWTFGGYITVRTLFSEGNAGPIIFLLVWLCGWAAGEVFVVREILYELIGRDGVSLDGNRMAVTRIALWKKSRWYLDRSRIMEILLTLDSPENSGWDSPCWQLSVGLHQGPPIRCPVQSRCGRSWVVMEEEEYDRALYLGKILAAWSGARLVVPSK